MSGIRPTFGYRKGVAKIFNLEPGDKFPAGWSDKPEPGDHPNAPHEQRVEPPVVEEAPRKPAGKFKGL